MNNNNKKIYSIEGALSMPTITTSSAENIEIKIEVKKSEIKISRKIN